MCEDREQLVTRLRDAGYKITPARLAVLQVIEAEDMHLNPGEILEQGRALCPKLGRATVYRTLEVLTRLGIVRPIYLGDGAPSFIRTDGGHHHLVCADCGAVVEFDECIAEELTQELQSRFGFQIQSHLLEFYGRCPQCVSAADQ
jgi:Fur family ferric uptake transcriptional regulator